MVSSELGVGTVQGWISRGLGLLDTVERGEVSAIRGIEIRKGCLICFCSASAEIESERGMRWRVRTRYGVPFSTFRRLVLLSQSSGESENLPDYVDCCFWTSPLCLMSKEGSWEMLAVICRGSRRSRNFAVKPVWEDQD